jgi:hypothetical protein
MQAADLVTPLSRMPLAEFDMLSTNARAWWRPATHVPVPTCQIELHDHVGHDLDPHVIISIACFGRRGFIPVNLKPRRVLPEHALQYQQAGSWRPSVTPVHHPVYRIRDFFRRFHNVVNSAPWQGDACKSAVTVGAPFIATRWVKFVRLDAVKGNTGLEIDKDGLALADLG